MNKKTFLILSLFLLLIFFLVWFFLFNKEKQLPKEDFGQLPGNSEIIDIPFDDIFVEPEKETDVCSDSINVFERNQCITILAQENNDKLLCQEIDGLLARSACEEEILTPNTVPTSIVSKNINPNRYENMLREMIENKNNPKITISTTSSPIISTSIDTSLFSSDNSKSIEDDFKYKLSYGAPLVVYSSSKYESLPNENIRIHGSGFQLDGNTVYFSAINGGGSISGNFGSLDGNTLYVQAPGSIGEYEIWVENSKGTSKLSDRIVKLTVTNSPKPVPVIFSATPSIVLPDEEVELTGSGFGEKNNILSSFGVLENVPSTNNGTRIKFKISDLPYIDTAKNTPQLKGSVQNIMVNIQNNGGFTEKVFEFSVKF